MSSNFTKALTLCLLNSESKFWTLNFMQYSSNTTRYYKEKERKEIERDERGEKERKEMERYSKRGGESEREKETLVP